VVVRSCHEVGKSWLGANVICWWCESGDPSESFAVSTAPSGPQVKAILWREIGRLHARARLPGRVNQTEWYVPVGGEGAEELVAFGRKPDEYEPTAFQGIHARRVLVLIDEANGVRGQLHAAAESLVANDRSKLVMVGNPDDPSGEFYDACQPGSGWHVESVGAFESPNFTGEAVSPLVSESLIGRLWVEERRRAWAPGWRWEPEGAEADPSLGPARVVPPEGADPQDTRPEWQSKVLGLFPRTAQEENLIRVEWIEAAQARAIPPGTDDSLGLDVGGGGDSSCCARLRGGHARVLWEDRQPNTMSTLGRLLDTLERTGAPRANVDEIGIGYGMTNRAREQARDETLDKGTRARCEAVEGVNVGRASSDPAHYLNARAEYWWAVRTMFENGEIDIDADDLQLAAELREIRYTRLSSGKIQIESKKEAKARGVASPNRAEAIMLARARVTRKKSRATWGKRRAAATIARRREPANARD
jgi:hypothetical protein